MQVLDMYQEARLQTPECWSISIEPRRHELPWNVFLEEKDIWVRLRCWLGEEAYIGFRRDWGCPCRKHRVNARPHSEAVHAQHKLWVSLYRNPGSICTNIERHMQSLWKHVEINKENSRQSNSGLPNSDNSPHAMQGSEFSQWSSREDRDRQMNGQSPRFIDHDKKNRSRWGWEGARSMEKEAYGWKMGLAPEYQAGT